MKCSILFLLAGAALAHAGTTYTGVVSGTKHFARGGEVVDLDGSYPHQKMTLYVPPVSEVMVGHLPPIGVTVTATGEVTTYRGRPEIRITALSQWSWK